MFIMYSNGKCVAISYMFFSLMHLFNNVGLGKLVHNCIATSTEVHWYVLIVAKWFKPLWIFFASLTFFKCFLHKCSFEFVQYLLIFFSTAIQLIYGKVTTDMPNQGVF